MSAALAAAAAAAAVSWPIYQSINHQSSHQYTRTRDLDAVVSQYALAAANQVLN